MRIGVDFDNTIVNTFEVSKRYLDEFLPGNLYKSYHELDSIKEKEFFSLYSEIITKNLSLKPQVKETFSYFKKNNIDIVMISRRGYNFEPLVSATLDFLNKNDVQFDEVYCKITNKGQFCKLNNIDLMIDDLDKELKKVNDYGIRVLKYGSKSDEFDYALSWDEVKEFVRKGLK